MVIARELALRRWRVVLKREQGGWRIEDFTPQ